MKPNLSKPVGGGSSLFSAPFSFKKTAEPVAPSHHVPVYAPATSNEVASTGSDGLLRTKGGVDVTRIHIKDMCAIDAILDNLHSVAESWRVSSPRAPPQCAIQAEVFHGHDQGASVSAFAFDSKDGRIATGGSDGRIVLWDGPTRKHVDTYVQHSGNVSGLRVCGDVVVSSSSDSTVRVASFPRSIYSYSSSDGVSASVVSSSTSVKLRGHTGSVTAIDVVERRDPIAKVDGSSLLPSKSNYVLASGGADGKVCIYSAEWNISARGAASGTAMLLSSHTNIHKAATPVESVSLSADGRLVVSAGRDGRIGIVDIPTSRVWTMTAPEKVSSGGLFGKKAVAAPVDPSLIPSGLPLVYAWADVSRRPVLITSVGADGAARLWDLRTGGCVLAFLSGSPIWASATVSARGSCSPSFAADGSVTTPGSIIGDNFLLTGHEDGVVRRWDARMPEHPEMGMGAIGSAPVTSLMVRGDSLVSGSADGSTRLWHAQCGIDLTCAGHQGAVTGVAVHDDFFASTSIDGTLRVWSPLK